MKRVIFRAGSAIWPVLFIAVILVTLSSGGARAQAILAMGDSMLAVNRYADSSVMEYVARDTGAKVVDRSVVGARFMPRLRLSQKSLIKIPRQYIPARWNWVVINGGGNDLWMDCWCQHCAWTLNQLISKDSATGAIVDMVQRARQDGARVIFVGYLHSPGTRTPADACRSENAVLEARLDAMAQRDPEVFFISLRDLVPEGDRSYHALDRIHPSFKGSEAIAARITAVIQNNP